MSEKSLKIFELCKQLAELLGDKEAIADIKLLYNRHPEMFKDFKEVSSVIDEVVKEPEIITNAKRDGAILVAKKLTNNHKMGEVGIENDSGTNVIFHANQKKISEFTKLERNSQLLVETPSAKAAPTRLDRCADNSKDLSMCDKALSTATPYQSPNANSILQTLLQASLYSANETDKGIIPNSNTQSQTHKSNNTKMSQDKQKSNTNEISM